jgi:hypothetical protein
MGKFKLRFSLRTLLVVFTVLAIAIAFIATHLRVVIGGLVAAMWLADFVGGPLLNFVDAWPELKKPRLAKPPRAEEMSEPIAGKPGK